MLPFLPPQGRGRFAPMRYIKNIAYSIPPRQVAFSSIELFYWAAAASISMTAVYLNSEGMNAEEVGRISALLALVGIVAPPVWGLISDKMRSVKRVFMLCMSAAALIYLLIPAVTGRFSIGLVWLMLPLSRFFFGPTNALLDSWIVRTVNADRRLSYGSIRMFGSVGFAIMAILYTYLIQRYNAGVVFYGLAILAVPTVLIASRAKDDSDSRRSIPLKELKLGRLLKIFPFTSFLMFTVALYMPVNASYTFLPYLIQSIGEAPSLSGAVVGIKALMEIPLLLLSARLIKKYKPTSMLVFASCIYTVEMLLYPFCTNIYAILAVQCIHGVLFGLYLSTQIQYVYSLAPEGLTATAQTLTGAATALAGIVGNLMGGFMIQRMGIHSFYFLSAAVQAAAVLMFVLSLRYSKKKAQEEASASA